MDRIFFEFRLPCRSCLAETFQFSKEMPPVSHLPGSVVLFFSICPGQPYFLQGLQDPGHGEESNSHTRGLGVKLPAFWWRTRGLAVIRAIQFHWLGRQIEFFEHGLRLETVETLVPTLLSKGCDYGMNMELIDVYSIVLVSCCYRFAIVFLSVCYCFAIVLITNKLALRNHIFQS